MDEFMQAIYPYLEALAIVIIVGITTLAGLAFKKWGRLLDTQTVESQAKTAESQQAILTSISKEGFAVAETDGKGAGGPKKLEMATRYALDKIERTTGIEATKTEVQASIHSAVIDNKAQAGTSTPKEGTK